jgi:hypothetical protein
VELVISADKMMNKAKGPVWHKKHKEKGFIPKGLRGLDQQETWCKSNADGWVYGHGSFSLTSHQHPVLGCFVRMKNSASEAKRMWLETFHWLFAAMGLTIQMHQLEAFKLGKSTWNIKERVLG